MDNTFVPPEIKQAYDQAAGQPPPWNGQSWSGQGQTSGSRSPRARYRSKSNRSRQNGKGGDWAHGDYQKGNKGYGKGPEHFAHAQGPQQQMMPMMMQFPQPMPPPVMQAPIIDKGSGKGMGNIQQPLPTMVLPPPPPANPPQMMTGANTSSSMSWPPAMPVMTFPSAPTASAACTPQVDLKVEGDAQKKLNRLLQEMKKEEDSLSPNLQSMAHEMKKQDEKNHMKGLHSALRTLGQAKDDLLEAENARAQLLSQWKNFLQQSVVKWKEFTANFQASDTAHQASVQEARLAVKRAQRSFDNANKREQSGAGSAQIISDDEEENDMSEEMNVEMDSREESAQKIHEGMSSIVASLEELSSSADQLEQRVKRPRTAVSEAPAVKSFGKAGDV